MLQRKADSYKQPVAIPNTQGLIRPSKVKFKILRDVWDTGEQIKM